MSKRGHRAKVHAIWWWDITAHPGWGRSKPLSLVVTIGVILKRPGPKDRRPVYEVYDSLGDEEPGFGTTIPASVVERIEKVGAIDLPWPVPPLPD